MKFENESQLSVRCFKCGCFGHRGLQCENFSSERRSQNPNAGGMLEKCWICGCLGHIAVECKEKQVTCFSCGERGHKQEDCTSPMANCWNCGKRGHIKKGCPLKKNVGMCFYCHQVGHHSKDCDQKVCYICASKNHLWTRCPLKALRGGAQPRSNGYLSRMRHVPRRQNHRKAFHPTQFSSALMLENQYYQSFAHQQQTPRCIRPKSDLLPLSSTQERNLAVSQQRTPVTMRRNSDPVGYSANLGPPQYDHPRLTHALDDLDLLANPSSFRSVFPQFRFEGQRSDFDGNSFDMGDIYSRSDESMLRVTELEKDKSPMLSLDGRRKSLIQNNSSVWKEIAPESDPGVATWRSSSDVWRSWDTGLELTNPEVPLTNKLKEKPGDNSGIEGVDSTSKEDCTINEREERDRKPVQNQSTVQPVQETQTESSEVPDSAGDRKEGVCRPNMMSIPSPTVTSTSIKDGTSSQISESTTSSGTQEDVKAEIVDVSLLEVIKSASKPAESTKTESSLEIQVNDVQEELERMREELADAKVKLVEKEQQLDNTQKIVQRLKDVMWLESAVKQKFCQGQDEHNTKGVVVRNRCANCIQILENLKSCEECVM